MSLLIYMNGELVPEEEAKVTVFDHGYLYGDGVFEGIRAYNGRVFKLTEHLERLYDSAKTIMLHIPIDLKEMEEAVLKTLRANQLYDAYIRLIVSRGCGDLGLDPTKCKSPNIVIIASKIQLYPEEFYQEGLEIATVPTRRNVSEGLNPRIKSLNYLNNILAKIEAKRMGLQEAIMLTSEGYVAECTGDNIFIVKDSKLITPPTHMGILKGITRDVVIHLAEKMGIKTSEEVFTRYDVFTAHECFLTGTAAEVIPVVKVDGRIIMDGRPGEITESLASAFADYVHSEGTTIYSQAV